MSNSRFHGAGVALITPFTPAGEVDYPSLVKVTQHTVDHGIDFLVVLGTTAETPTLTTEEKEKVIQTILEVNAGRKPVVLGIGGNDTASVIKQLQNQSLTGIQAILTVAPYYNKPNQTGLLRHFEAIGTVSPLPVIIYNVPGRTGSNISADTTLRLASDVPNIIATKEASGNLEQIMIILRDRPAGFSVLSGDDSLTLPLVSLGAEGVISVIANLFPGEMSKMVHLATEGNMEGARRIHYELLEIITLIFAEGSPAGIKSALKQKGLGDDSLRLPLVPVSSVLSEKIRINLEKLGVS
jgi:4-hydroxy-tetrahydrodipicolinate synthase